MNAKTHLPMKTSGGFLTLPASRTNLPGILMCLALIVLLLPTLTADTEQEFLDSVNITVTVTPTLTQIEWDLNTTGKDFDIQDITYNNVTLHDVSIQEILNGAHWEFELEQGEKPRFKCICIKESSVTAILLDALLDDMDAGFTVSEINDDVSVLNDYLAENAPTWEEVDSNFSKKGTHYTVVIEKGYQDDDVEDLIKEGVDQANVGKILNDLFSMVAPEALNDSISETGFDFMDDINYTIVSTDMSEVRLEDGTYNVPVNIHCNDNGQDYVEDVTLILEGIRNNDMMCPVNGTYFPGNDGIEAYIVNITGLGVNTINVTLFDFPAPSAPLPDNAVRVVKYMEISVANQTSAVIHFKVPTTKVTDATQVDFYVREGNSWVQLSTTLMSTSAGHHFYSANVAHFSQFMILEHEPETESSGGSGSSVGSSGGRSQNNTQPVITSSGGQGATELEPIATTEPVPTENPEENRGITGAIVDGLGQGSAAFAIFAILVICGIVMMVIFRSRQRIAEWFA